MYSNEPKDIYYSLNALLFVPGNQQGYFDFALTTVREKRIISMATGIDVSGFLHSIGRDDINHILNRHQTETFPDQLDVSEEDILKIPFIIQSANSIEYAGKSRRGRDVIRYIKKGKVDYYVLEEIRIGRNKLTVKTFFKKEGGY